jgi:hypothetical protein
MKRWLLLVVAIASFAAAPAQEGWARYRVFTPGSADVERLLQSPLELFSCEPEREATDVVVGPGQIRDLQALLLPFFKVSDLPRADEWQHVDTSRSDYHNSYLRYNDIIAKYEEWRAQAPYYVSRQQIGTSIQGRAIWAYRFGPPEFPGSQIRRVVILGGTHAREWITNNVVMYLAQRTMEDLVASGNRGASRRQVILYVVPNANPDGYEFSWNTDRMWRKNRRNNGGGVYGVDLNRNYSTGWGGPGSSGSPSSATYRGTAAFSEPETAAIRNFCLGLDNLAGVIDYHNFSEMILWPWSYVTSPPEGLQQMLQVGENMRQAMIQHGFHDYTNGQASSTLYVASGTSKDYFFQEFGAFSCTIELRDKGQHGFLLPESQIWPSQQEAWVGFRAFVNSLP